MSHIRTSLLRTHTRPSIHEIASLILTPFSQSKTHHPSQSISRPRPLSTTCLYHQPRRTPLFHPQTPSRNYSTSRKTHNRGPVSDETTQTDFGSLDVLGNIAAPSTSIDACLTDGFHLNSGVKIIGKGVLLLGGEAFGWKPWVASAVGREAGGIGGKEEGFREAGGKKKMRRLGEGMVNEKGQWEVGDEAWGLLACVWPRPDLLILGVGREMRPLSPKTRAYISGLGIRIDVQDTRNAAAQFNLLATERGVSGVAAALVPLGF